MLAWAIPGAVVGLAALRALDSTALQIGGHARRVRDAGRALARAAAARARRGRPAGVGGARRGPRLRRADHLDQHRGPAVVLYMLARGAPPVQTRDTLTVDVHRLRGDRRGRAGASAGTTGCRTRAALAALVPAVVVGHLAGRPVFARIAEHRYEPVLTGVLIATALAGLATALL